MAGADLRVGVDPIFRAFGVPVTVTRPAPEDTPIETEGVWHAPMTDQVPTGLDLTRADPQRVMALRRDAVPTVPRGTVLAAPETIGGPVALWRLDGVARWEIDLVRVPVVPA